MKKIIFALAVVLIAVLGVAFYGSSKAKESYDRGVARLTGETLRLPFIDLKANVTQNEYDKGLFSSRATLTFELTGGKDPVKFEAKTTLKHGFAEIFSGFKAHSDIKALTPEAAAEAKKIFGTDEFLSADVLINLDKTRDVTLNLAEIKVEERNSDFVISKPFAKAQIKENKIKSLEIGVGKVSGGDTDGVDKFDIENASALIELNDFKSFDDLISFINIQTAYENIAKIGVKTDKMSFNSAKGYDFPKSVGIAGISFLAQTKQNADANLLDTLTDVSLGALDVDGKKVLEQLNLSLNEKNVNKEAMAMYVSYPQGATLYKILMSKNYVMEVKNFSFKNPNGKELKFNAVADASGLGAESKTLHDDVDIQTALKAVKFDGEIKVQTASITEFLGAYKGLMADSDFNQMMDGIKPFEERVNSLFAKEGEYMSAKFKHDVGSDDLLVNDKISLKEFIMSLMAN
jgi:putative DNA-binding response regulator